MTFFRTAIALLILCSQGSPVLAEETTPLPIAAENEDSHGISLDEAIKQVLQEGKVKVLGAKTEVEQGKKIHIIKVLTAKGHIQYIRIDAATGKTIEREKK